MKKEYMKPLAEYISLAAAERIATGATYYDDSVGGPGTDMGTTSDNLGWWD